MIVRTSTPPGALQPVWLYAAVLVGAIAITDAARAWVPALQGLTQLVAAAERPPDDDHYLANDSGGQIDHHVLWFGLDAEVTRRLRAAEVLFVGNSRLMFALRPALLRPFFADLGVPYYVMGFGHREADRFPLEMIRRYDLRPRLVVVNADGFFGGGLSPWAEVVNRDTPFAARKFQWESEVAHEVRRYVHRVVPNWFRLFGAPGLGLRRGFIAYRSRRDGTWAISPWPEGTQGFADGSLDGPELGRGEIAAARAFKAELDRRGARMVITRVPSPEPMPGAGPARFAELLEVPLALATVPGLTTADNSHLSEGSAHDWTRALLGTLEPLVRDAGTSSRPSP
ncbi:MAG: hypothetical protein AB7U83_02220 [Vicinamibacterales bacterium]